MYKGDECGESAPMANMDWCHRNSVDYRNRVYFSDLPDAVRTIACDAMAKSKSAKYRLWDWLGEKRGREIVKRNVDLIKTIDKEQFPKIVKAVIKALKMEWTRDQLVEYIEKVGEVETDRAELIADDQMGKALVLAQLEKWKSAGWRRVQWKHAPRVKEPREYHRRKWDGRSGLDDGHPNGLNGFVFKIDNPPVIDEKTGERGYPAQLVNCLCYLVPYD